MVSKGIERKKEIERKSIKNFIEKSGILSPKKREKNFDPSSSSGITNDKIVQSQSNPDNSLDSSIPQTEDYIIDQIKERVIPNSSSTNTTKITAEETIKCWLKPYEQLDLLTPVMQNYIMNQIKEKVISTGKDVRKTNTLEYIDYVNIIRPYIKFNNYLRRVKNREQTWDFMKLFFYEPTTIMHLCLDWPTETHKETKMLEQNARRVAHKMVSFGILSTITVGSKLYGIPYNRRLRNCAIYYIKGLHTQEELDFEIKRYGEYAERIGMIRDLIDPEDIENIKSRIMKKKERQTLEALFDQTEQGQQVNKVIQQSKSKKQLDTKAVKLGVLRTPLVQQSKEIQEGLQEILVPGPKPEYLLTDSNFEICLRCGKKVDPKEFFGYHGGKHKMCIPCAKEHDYLR